MKSMGEIFAPWGAPGCRRCGVTLVGPFDLPYCDACFDAIAPQLVEALRVEVADRERAWREAGHELAAALHQLGQRHHATERDGTAEPQDAKPPLQSPEPTPAESNKRIVPALLFASRDPVPVEVLAEVLGTGAGDVEEALGVLAEELRGLGLEVRRRKSGVELGTLQELGGVVARLRKVRPPRELTVHARETLFILMRRGRPCTKAEIAEVRGRGRRGELIDVGPVLGTLRKEGLVAKAGVRDDAPGRPSLYVATKKARERFPDLSGEAARLLAP